jgi:hypothetical protein
MLVPQEHGQGLELRAHGGRHTTAQGGCLDFTGGSGEDRDDVAIVADATLLRGGTASAFLALAWSSQKLLLWNAGHAGHGSMLVSPTDGRGTSWAEGLLLRTPSRPADPRASTQLATAGIPCGPEPPTGRLDDDNACEGL